MLTEDSIECRRFVADPLKTNPSHMCHHVKFGSSATKGVRINRKKPPKLGSARTPPPLGGGVADP